MGQAVSARWLGNREGGGAPRRSDAIREQEETANVEAEGASREVWCVVDPEEQVQP